MTEPGDPISPVGDQSTTSPFGGLTKREYFAAAAMRGLLANSYYIMYGTEAPVDQKTVSAWAVSYADTLIQELNK